MVMKRAGGDGRGSLAGISGSPWLGGIEFSGDGTKKAFGTRASRRIMATILEDYRVLGSLRHTLVVMLGVFTVDI
jgi:hypothetical protein